MKADLSTPLLSGSGAYPPHSLLYTQLFLLGLGSLVTWHTVSPTFDWINQKYPGQNASQTYTLLNFLPNLLFQPLLVWYGYLLPLNLRITGSYIFQGLFLLSIPLVIQFTTASFGYTALMILAMLLGVCNAVMQASIYALAGTLPTSCLNAVLVGSGLSGVIMNSVRMGCLAGFGHERERLERSTEIFYTLAVGIIALSLTAQYYIMNDPFVEECIKRTSSKLRHTSETAVKRPAPRDVIRAIWDYMLFQFLTLTVTFGVYPTLVISARDSTLSPAWFSVVMLFTYSLMDFIGRHMPNYYVPSKWGVCGLVIGRFGFWASFTIAALHSSVWPLNTLWGKLCNVGLFSLTGGYSGTVAMSQAPASVVPSWKDMAGAVMSSVTSLALVSGSLVAFLLPHP